MSRDCSCKTAIAGVAMLVAGMLYTAQPARGATLLVPVVMSVTVDPSGLLVVGQKAAINCQIASGDEKTLTPQQQQFLASHGGKLPAEIRVDGKQLFPFAVTAPSANWYSTKAFWTPAPADAGKKHQFTCAIDPQGKIKASSETISLKVVAKLPNTPKSLPGASKAKTSGSQSKQTLAIPYGGYAVKPKSPSKPAGAAGVVPVSPLPDLIISDLRPTWSTACRLDGYRDFNLHAKVKNLGAGPVEGILYVRFYVNQVVPQSVSDVLDAQDVTGHLASGKATLFKAHLEKIGGSRIGEQERYVFHAKVDSYGFVKEVNEQNNHKEFTSWMTPCPNEPDALKQPSHGFGTAPNLRLPTAPHAPSPSRGSTPRLKLPVAQPGRQPAHSPSTGTR